MFFESCALEISTIEGESPNSAKKWWSRISYFCRSVKKYIYCCTNKNLGLSASRDMPYETATKKIKLFFFPNPICTKKHSFRGFFPLERPPSRLLHVNQPQQPPPGPMASGGDCITPQTVASALNQNPSLSFSAFARGGEGGQRSYVMWPWIAQEGFIRVSRSRRGKGNKSGYRSE